MNSLLERSAHLTPASHHVRSLTWRMGLSKTMVISNTLNIEEPKNLKIWSKQH